MTINSERGLELESPHWKPMNQREQVLHRPYSDVLLTRYTTEK